MTKTAWIVVGIAVALGVTALTVWQVGENQRAKREKDDVLKSLKDSGGIK
jgi:hypothetical protein